uniref:Putative Flp pilus-assembly TadG-like N-terminal domain-containing protein n=1 Tax=Solibacter usitatus (strain Ellin6076) TaxID=234267 RepID=Q01SB9_SOLUE
MPRRPKSRRGFVLVTMALSTVAVLGVVGLAVDVGRIFIAKNEVQVYCDSAAVAAAAALDGTTYGIAAAAGAAAASPNKWNFGTTAILSPLVTFAQAPGGPWLANPNSAAGYTYAHVAASVTVPLYFLPLVVGQSTSAVTAAAAAGQISLAALPRGLAPYTAVSTNTAGPTFGFVAGNSYTIHWPTYNANRSHCRVDNPDKCFNSPPCAGDSAASLSAVVANWGSKYHGYWGSNSNSDIAAAVMDTIQLTPLAVGDNVDPLLTPGNKQSEAGYLDQRASQDTDTTDNTVAGYLASAGHNGRRLLPVAIVNPIDPEHTIVTGYGQFLLYSNGSSSDYYKKNGNGNSPYCAVYAGPFNIGSLGPGAGGATGASFVRLVE